MASATTEPTSYDVVPYPGNPYRDSHPDHLATIARLFGIESPEVNTCRVLELGCACGANLIPMAVSVPTAQFVGIDLSGRQIDEARETITALGLANIDVRQRSITDITPDDGLFDYIVCHGVFSWVPDAVREHILEVCSRNLSPRGIAYISYNTYPGWFMRGMVRRMMGFHAKQFAEPEAQLGQARALLDFLAESCKGGDPAYQALLARELDILRQCNDSYLFHEHLEDVNEPMFFHEFAALAARHKLRYLAEPHLREMVAVNVDPQVGGVLQKLGANIIHYEQYLDFLRNRTFRRTLLCHDSQVPSREIGPDRMQFFRITSHLKQRNSAGSLLESSPWEFAGAGQNATVSHPAHKAILLALEQAGPTGIACESLAGNSTRLLSRAASGGPVPDVSSDEVRDLVLQLHVQGLLEISVSPPRFTVAITTTPCASPLARRQAATGPIVTNLRHERVKLEPLDQAVIQTLDGQRNCAELAKLLDQSFSEGNVTISNESGPIDREHRTPELIGAILDHSLRSLANQAILVSSTGP